MPNRTALRPDAASAILLDSPARLSATYPVDGEETIAVKMRAAVLEQFGEPLNVTEVELDEPRAGEVLVRLEACGVCHTDMYTASGADPSGYAPTVLGHEGAGSSSDSAKA